jgi:hypothetical protein
MGQKLGNSWRIGPDDTNWGGVLANIDINAALAAYAGPEPDGSGGGWNDPCLLLAEEWTGQQRMTELQTRAQFNMFVLHFLLFARRTISFEDEKVQTSAFFLHFIALHVAFVVSNTHTHTHVYFTLG